MNLVHFEQPFGPMAPALNMGLLATIPTTCPSMRAKHVITLRSNSGFSSKIDSWSTRVRNSFRMRSEEHTSELQSLMRISYAVFCLKKKTKKYNKLKTHKQNKTNIYTTNKIRTKRQ